MGAVLTEVSRSRFIWLLAGIISSSILIGCGGKKKEDSNTSTEETSSTSTEETSSTSSVPVAALTANQDGIWQDVSGSKVYYIDGKSLKNVSTDYILGVFVENTQGSKFLYSTPIEGENTSQDIKSYIVDFPSTGLARIESQDDSSVIYLVRSGIDDIKLSGKLTSFEGFSLLGKSAAVYDITLKNKNGSEEKKTKIASNGTFEATDIETGTYEVNVTENGESVATIPSVEIENSTSDIGNISTAESTDYNFKAQLVSESEFHFNQFQYEAKLRVTNVGSSNALGANYTLSSDEPSLTFLGGTEKGVLKTIEAGDHAEADIKYKFSNMDLVEHKRVKIDVVIKDVRGTSWDDVIYIDLYNSYFDINVNSALSDVSGTLIFKDRKLVRFNSTFRVPYITGFEYKILMSASSIDKESIYSLGIDVAASERSYLENDFSDTSAFEPNDSEDKAHVLSFREKVDSYLHVGDLDFYKFNLTDGEILGPRPKIVSSDVITDDNGDGKIAPGETVYLKIKVRNEGTSGVLGAFGTVSSSNEGITISYYNDGSGFGFGDLAPGEEKCGFQRPTSSGYCDTSTGSYYLKVAVDTSVSAADYTLDLLLTDNSGVEYKLPFVIKIAPPETDFTLVSSSVMTDENGDGVINPGERVYLRVKIKNAGAAKALGVSGTVSPLAGFTISYYNDGSGFGFGDLAPGEEKCGFQRPTSSGYCDTSTGSYYLKILASETLTPGTYSFPLQLSDTYGNQQDTTFSMDIVNPTYSFTLNSADLVTQSGSVRYYKVRVTNTDPQNTVWDLSGTVSTSTAGVTVSYYNDGSGFGFGDLAPGEEKCGFQRPTSSGYCDTSTGSYYLKVDYGAVTGTVNFDLDLTHQLGTKTHTYSGLTFSDTIP